MAAVEIWLRLRLRLRLWLWLWLLLLPRCCFGPAPLVTRETKGHPKGGAHGRAPGPSWGRMPHLGPARESTALVAFDSNS
jgi:hypothetical protein